jgi:cytochrome d ubiquinol oxidase subunit II
MAFSGFIISLWPMIIPPNISIWDAAAPRSSQAFTLVGAVILIPIILVYTALSYWVFRGKIHVGSDGYH